MTTYKIYQDGKLMQEFNHQENDWEPFKWLLRNQCQSTDYALRWGGWKVEEVDEETNKSTYWNPYSKA